MKLHTTLAIGAALLCGASMPALAAQTDYCARLQQLTDQNRSRFNGEWAKQADAVLQSRNAQNCQRYAEQAEGAVRQLNQQAAGGTSQTQQAGSTETQSSKTQQADSQTTAGGAQIMVQQPQPQVTVQQQPPQVQVKQPQPQVTVNQPQPQIIVRQAQPVVTLQMPQPVVTIEQPQPEIIVRMPPPQVAVNTPQPQVEVRQAQPQVEVKQAKPQVQVEMQQPRVNVEQNSQAQVSVERAQPVVQLQQQGKADVQVQQQQPQVSYEAAKPKVQVQQAGEPKVEFRQTGQPNIRFEQMQGQQAANSSEQQKTASGSTQQQQAEDQTGSTGKAGFTEQDRQRIGMLDAGQKARPAQVHASQLVNKPIISHQGEQLGTVKAIRREGGRDFVVIDHGGTLSLPEAQFMVPAERVAIDKQGRVVLLGLTQQDFTAIPQMKADAGEAVKASQTIRVSQIQ